MQRYLNDKRFRDKENRKDKFDIYKFELYVILVFRFLGHYKTIWEMRMLRTYTTYIYVCTQQYKGRNRGTPFFNASTIYE